MASSCEAYRGVSGVYRRAELAAVKVWRSFLHLMSADQGRSDPSGCVDERTEVLSCQNGDQDVYERLVRRYQDQVGSLLWRFTHDRGVHEDLVHQVFVEAWVSLGKYRGDGSFPAWLSTIATRVGYSYWKQKKRVRDRNEVSIEGVAELSTTEQQSCELDPFEPLERALQLLSPRDRLVLTLLYLEERSVADAARLTGWSPSMVKVQAHRARGRLKRLMQTDDE